ELAVLVARVEMADAHRVRDLGAEHRPERIGHRLADEFACREFVQGTLIFRALRAAAFRPVVSGGFSWHREVNKPENLKGQGRREFARLTPSSKPIYVSTWNKNDNQINISSS